MHVGPLESVVAAGIVGDLVRRAGRPLAVGAHGYLLDVAPEGTKVQVVAPAGLVLDQVPVNSVVVLAGAGGDARGSAVGPAPVFHG